MTTPRKKQIKDKEIKSLKPNHLGDLLQTQGKYCHNVTRGRGDCNPRDKR